MGLSNSNFAARHDVKEASLRETLAFLKDVFIANQKSPSEAQKMMASVIGCSDEEMKKSQEAKEYIAQHQTILANIKKLQINADAALSEANRVKNDAKNIQEANSERSAFLDKRENELQSIHRAHIARENEHKIREKSLDERKAELSDFDKSLKARESAVNSKHQEVMDHESELRKRAKNLKLLAESF